jgi:hypothetical protein
VILSTSWKISFFLRIFNMIWIGPKWLFLSYNNPRCSRYMLYKVSLHRKMRCRSPNC